MRSWIRKAGLTALAAVLALAGAADRSEAQGVTTSALQGVVTQEQGGTPIEGAVVSLVNTATGQRYQAMSRSTGRYLLENIAPGGPYTLEVRAIGYQPATRSGITVALGQRATVDLTLTQAVVELQELTVEGGTSPLINASRTGAAQTISASAIENLPLQGRNFTDLIQVSPQVVGTNVSGQNNRYNNLQIDGGVNNDLFGLAETGTPGGQARTKPISIDAVQEFQILVAPFDVRQGQFTGGLVNAITKSGTNQLSGSLFGYYQEKGLAGFRSDPSFGDYSLGQFGGTLGGPIVRDRAHFFLSIDAQTSDASYTDTDNLTGNDAQDLAQVGFTTEEVDRFADILANEYGLADVGTGATPSLATPNLNVFGKVSIQLGVNSLLEVSHNFIDASRDILSRSPTSPAVTGRLRDGWQLSNSGYTFDNSTNTTRAKWAASFANGASNEFLAGYQRIRDIRSLPTNAPLILTRVGNVGASDSWLAAGAERFSQGNSLDQDIFSIQNNLSFGNGAHRFTVGTSNEFFSFNNVFFQASIGVWAFSSLDSLANNQPLAFQRRLPTAARPEGPIADFGARQLGFYAQDDWTPNQNLTVTGGLRVDVPFLDSPITNPALAADPAFPITTGDYPSGNLLFSPRLGFNYDPTGDLSMVVRGGVGIFSGRPPYVWMSNAFTNTGLEQVELTCAGAGVVPAFTVDPAAQPTACATGPAPTLGVPNEVNYFDEDFKYPQKLRAALGVDRQLGRGFVGTVDLLYTKDVNEFYVQDANVVLQGQDAEGRSIYGTFDPATGRASVVRRTSAVRSAILHTNSSAGRSYSATAQLQKRLGTVDLNAAYTWSNTQDVISFTSSQAFSNYQFGAVDGPLADRNLRTSAFDVPHKLTLSGTAALPYDFGVSLIYVGRSGYPYAWTVNGDANADNISGNDLPFIPASADQILLADASEYAALDEFIDSQDCLNEQRGELHERNSCRNPWQNYLNARITKGFRTVGMQSVELSLDIFNVLNFVNNDWGLIKEVSQFEQGPRFLRVVGYDAAANRPIYDFSAPDLSTLERIVYRETENSRWRMQLGAKYRF